MALKCDRRGLHAIFWVYISGYQVHVTLSSLLDGLFANYFPLKSLSLSLKSHMNVL